MGIGRVHGLDPIQMVTLTVSNGRDTSHLERHVARLVAFAHADGSLGIAKKFLITF